SEAQKLKCHLSCPAEPFAALDPCAGDGVAFTALLENTPALRYGIELDSYRAEHARKLGVEVVHGNTLETQCRVGSLSLVYLNPPYDFEVGKTDNQRMEMVFLRHTGRWIMPGGILIFIVRRIPDASLRLRVPRRYCRQTAGLSGDPGRSAHGSGDARGLH